MNTSNHVVKNADFGSPIALFVESLLAARRRLPYWCPNCDMEMIPVDSWAASNEGKTVNLRCVCGRSVNIVIYPRHPELFPLSVENVSAFPYLFYTLAVVLIRGKNNV